MREYEATMYRIKAAKIMIEYCANVSKALSPVGQYLPNIGYLVVRFNSWGVSIATFITMTQYFILPSQVRREIMWTKQERL